MDGSTRVAAASERPLYQDNPSQWQFDLQNSTSKLLINKGYEDQYPGQGMILIPGYLRQLGFLPDTIGPITISPDDPYEQYIENLAGQVTENEGFGGQLMALLIGFYEDGVMGRGYRTDKQYLTVVDKGNQVRDTLKLGEEWAGSHPCEDLSVRFLSPQLVEVEETIYKWSDTPGEYTFATAFRYYQISDEGEIKPLDRPRKYDITHATLLEARHLKGCYYLPMTEAERAALDEEDYTNYTHFKHLRLEDLDVMRNEIFAEYGYRFKSEKWQRYFGAMDWYTPRYDNVDDQLTEIEKRNVQFLLDMSSKMREDEATYTPAIPCSVLPCGVIFMKGNHMVQSFLKTFTILLIMIIGLGIAIGSLRYLSPDFSQGFLRDKAAIFDGLYRWGLYLHMLGTPVALFVGGCQAFFRYEWTRRTLHRWLGRSYVIAVIFLAAPGGLIMAPYAGGGWWGKASFVVLGVLWIGFTAIGWSHARAQRWTSHRRWMVRNIC